MKEALDKLWEEHFAEKCAAIDTEEERVLAKKVALMHKTVNELLTKEQLDAIEKYIEALREIQESFVKKAFFKGCEFAVSFFL